MNFDCKGIVRLAEKVHDARWYWTRYHLSELLDWHREFGAAFPQADAREERITRRHERGNKA
jgi:hypothetical protein